jgi:hypothetical protein
MSEPRTPGRLLDPASGCSPLGRKLLRAARADAPSERRTWAVVAAALANAPAPGGEAAAHLSGIRPTKGAAGVSTAAKVVAGAGLAGCMAFVVVRIIAAHGSVAPVGGAVGAPASPATPSMVAIETPMAASPRVDDRIEHEPPTVSVDDLPSAAHQPAANAPHRDEPKAARGAEAAPPPAGQASTVEQTSIEAELAQLRGARDAIRRGAPQEAIDALDGYARRFPNGVLKPEAEALSIEAKVAAGRIAEARADADAFLAAHADAPQAPRIRLIRDRLRLP